MASRIVGPLGVSKHTAITFVRLPRGIANADERPRWAVTNPGSYHLRRSVIAHGLGLVLQDVIAKKNGVYAIINLSLSVQISLSKVTGSADNSPGSLDEEIFWKLRALANLGVSIVTAGGNQGYFTKTITNHIVYWKPRIPSLICVGAVDEDGAVADLTQWQIPGGLSGIDAWAPGMGLQVVTGNGEGKALVSGTSGGEIFLSSDKCCTKIEQRLQWCLD